MGSFGVLVVAPHNIKIETRIESCFLQWSCLGNVKPQRVFTVNVYAGFALPVVASERGVVHSTL